MAEQPLFNFDLAGSSSTEVAAPSSGPSTGVTRVWNPAPAFHDVPQATFLSWPPEAQRAYCAARDRDSAVRADSEEWRQFFTNRAESYE